MENKTAFMTCRACGFAGSFPLIAAREMLAGWRHPFEYGECPRCGSLQIREIPPNLSDYYPSDYFSLQAVPTRRREATVFRLALARATLSRKNPLGGLLAHRLAHKAPFFQWCRIAECGLESKILDFGCGSGRLLRRMQRYGFRDLTGMDPYLPSEIEEQGFRLRRADLASSKESYDLIMMNHVLEHVPDPTVTLSDAKARLAPGGKILVRIPLAASHTWRLYREHWFNLDPPRHLLVPSRLGMETLAAREGLRVTYLGFEGDEKSFFMSENYRRDIPYAACSADAGFHSRRFRRDAAAANRRGEGDQGIFLLVAHGREG